jgi:hypothetical protein
VESDDLADWLTERFGTREKRLVTDPGLEEPLVVIREELTAQLAGIVSRQAELEERYRESLRRGAERDADDPQRKELLREAQLAKKRYKLRSEQLVRRRRRLVAVLVVEVLREFDGIPDPEGELPIVLTKRFSETRRDVPGFDSVEDGDLTDVADVVCEAFDFDVQLWPTLDLETEGPETVGFPGEHTHDGQIDEDQIDISTDVDDHGSSPVDLDEEIDIDIEDEDHGI